MGVNGNPLPPVTVVIGLAMWWARYDRYPDRTDTSEKLKPRRMRGFREADST